MIRLSKGAFDLALGVTSLVLCAYGVLPELAAIQHPRSPEAVYRARRALRRWAAGDGGIAFKLRKLEVVMRERGLNVEDEEGGS